LEENLLVRRKFAKRSKFRGVQLQLPHATTPLVPRISSDMSFQLKISITQSKIPWT